jgi:flagellar protein FlaI
MMNVVAQLNRTKFHDTVVRRITELSEIDEKGCFKRLFEWDPRDDSIKLVVSNFKQSIALNRVANTKHIPVEQVVEDLERRELILNWMVQNKINTYDQVADLTRKFYLNPKEMYNQVRLVS